MVWAVNFDSSRLKIGIFGRSGQWLIVSSVQFSTRKNNCWGIVPLPTTMHTRITFLIAICFCICLPTWAHWVELPCSKSGAIAQGPTLNRCHTLMLCHEIPDDCCIPIFTLCYSFKLYSWSFLERCPFHPYNSRNSIKSLINFTEEMAFMNKWMS